MVALSAAAGWSYRADGLILDERLRPTGARLVLPMVDGMREFVTNVPIVVEASIRPTWAEPDLPTPWGDPA